MVRKASLLIDVKIGWNRLLQKKSEKTALELFSKSLTKSKKFDLALYDSSAAAWRICHRVFFLRQSFDDANEDASTSVLRWQLRLVYNL